MRRFVSRLTRLSAACAIGAGLSACGELPDGAGDRPALAPGEGTCVVTISLTEGVGINSLQASGNFASAVSTPVVDGHFVRCNPRIPTGLASLTALRPCYDDDCADTPYLVVMLNDRDTIDAPAPLLECMVSVSAGAVPDARDFTFVVDHATTARPWSELIEPAPKVAVTHVDCGGSTTSTTTSTTLPTPCQDVDCGPNQVCSDGDCVDTTRYEVEIAAAGDALYAALQYIVYYDDEVGAFVGLHDEAHCSANHRRFNSFTTFNHDPGKDVPVLNVAMTSFPGGIQAPTWLIRCVFESAGAVVDRDVFEIEFVDASNADLEPLPTPGLEVSAIRPLAPE